MPWRRWLRRGALEDLGLSGPLRTGLVKLAAALPAMQQPALEYARQRLHVDACPWFAEREPVPHLAVLRDAVWRDRRVSLTYRDFDGERGRRVEGARMLPQTVEKPPRFDLPIFWKDWCVRFAEKRAQYDGQLETALQSGDPRAIRQGGPPTRL